MVYLHTNKRLMPDLSVTKHSGWHLSKATKAIRVHKDHKAFKDLKALMVLKDHKVQQAPRDLLALKDHRALLVQQHRKDRRVMKVL
jgi:hypothetical protein